MSILSESLAQKIVGCADPEAKNYNPLANINDGTCEYETTVYNPTLKYILPEEIKETSGLIYYNEGLWTINDSGNPSILYKFKPETGQILQRISLTNTKNKDWEALAQDEECIYIGDIGNNSGNRVKLKIWIVYKEDLPSYGDKSVVPGLIEFSFPDHPRKKIKNKENNNFDCEAMICVKDSLYLFSKNRGDNKTRLYCLPKKEGNYQAELVDTFDSKGLITGADYNRQLKEITLVGYTNKTWQPFIWLLFDFRDNLFFSGNCRRIDLQDITATQTEAVSYTNNRNCVITSEGHPLFLQTAYDFYSGIWIQDVKVENENATMQIEELNTKEIENR